MRGEKLGTNSFEHNLLSINAEMQCTVFYCTLWLA